MVVSTTGNVGIGTTEPSQKLNVAGTVGFGTMDAGAGEPSTSIGGSGTMYGRTRKSAILNEARNFFTIFGDAINSAGFATLSAESWCGGGGGAVAYHFVCTYDACTLTQLASRMRGAETLVLTITGDISNTKTFTVTTTGFTSACIPTISLVVSGVSGRAIFTNSP